MALSVNETICDSYTRLIGYHEICIYYLVELVQRVKRHMQMYTTSSKPCQMSHRTRIRCIATTIIATQITTTPLFGTHIYRARCHNEH